MLLESPPIPSPQCKSIIFAWQGWQLRVPAEWNATSLGGTFSRGHALLADLDGPRLGVRWKRIPPDKVTQAYLKEIVRSEAGASSACEVVDLSPDHQAGSPAFAAARLDSATPGRDVYAAWFAESGRLIELVCHAHEREGVLMHQLVPSLRDTSTLPRQPWCVLDLACTVPTGFELRSHDLCAGDLRLNWVNGRRFISVRQLAMAQTVLRQTPLERLVQQAQRHAQYRRVESVLPETVVTADGREIMGQSTLMRRRRRFTWRTDLATQRVTLALHDPDRDRIVVVEADDVALARDVAATVGGELR